MNDPAMAAVYLDDMLPPEPGYILKKPGRGGGNEKDCGTGGQMCFIAAKSGR